MQTLPFLHPDVCIEEAWNAGLSHRVLGYSARQTSIFRSGGEIFAVFVCTKRTSHIPHVVIWFSLIFDREVEGGIWLVCLQMTTASKFYEEFNRKTLVAGCLRSSLRMESTDIVWLVLALTCFGPSLLTPHKNLILRFWVFPQSYVFPLLSAAFVTSSEHKVKGNYPPPGTLQGCWIGGPKFTALEKLACLPRPQSVHGKLMVCSLCNDLQQADGAWQLTLLWRVWSCLRQ